jgi:hypothetical protein
MSDFTRTEAEYAQLQSERDAIREASNMARRRIEEFVVGEQHLHTRNRQLRNALTSVEWVPAFTAGPVLGSFCPACRRRKEVGHAPECQIAAVLGRVTKE